MDGTLGNLIYYFISRNVLWPCLPAATTSISRLLGAFSDESEVKRFPAKLTNSTAFVTVKTQVLKILKNSSSLKGLPNI